ncbi:hypothetical protein [Actinomyces marmotae]|uniref:Uncharacterized protein n=1 Tax=Actinomyces marmotae TaxID=2737173 RepID=A0A6M8B755_9ACTO|nr:hypothetical protein [Actinomyces marmotae]QKD79073.1 hypothetical protein HPC72_01275 [Actinomyces marmotae]
MTDQSPYPPQQPYQPYQPYPQPSAPSSGRPDYARAPQAGMPQYPYAAAPYPGQPMAVYPVMPYLRPMGPQRPGTATGASVLGIISGGLGLLLAVSTIILTTTLDALAQLVAASHSRSTAVMIDYVLGFGVFVTAVALLTTSITFFKGKGYGGLLGAAIAQAVVTVLLHIVFPLMLPRILGLNSSDLPDSIRFNSGTVFYLVTGLGLAVSTIILLLNPSTKSWRK